MNIIEEIKSLQQQGKLGKYFTVEEVKSVTDSLEADNLSNYALDNDGSSNRNNKVLNRRKNSKINSALKEKNSTNLHKFLIEQHYSQRNYFFAIFQGYPNNFWHCQCQRLSQDKARGNAGWQPPTNQCLDDGFRKQIYTADVVQQTRLALLLNSCS